MQENVFCVTSEEESEVTYIICFSEAWRRRRKGKPPLGNPEQDQKIADQLNTELKTEPDKDLKTKFENDPEVEFGTEYENDAEVALGTEHENEPEVKLGTEYENDHWGLSTDNDSEVDLGTEFKDQEHDYNFGFQKN